MEVDTLGGGIKERRETGANKERRRPQNTTYERPGVSEVGAVLIHVDDRKQIVLFLSF